jgi:hypothetical protein
MLTNRPAAVDDDVLPRHERRLRRDQEQQGRVQIFHVADPFLGRERARALDPFRGDEVDVGLRIGEHARAERVDDDARASFCF